MPLICLRTIHPQINIRWQAKVLPYFHKASSRYFTFISPTGSGLNCGG